MKYAESVLFLALPCRSLTLSMLIPLLYNADAWNFLSMCGLKRTKHPTLPKPNKLLRSLNEWLRYAGSIWNSADSGVRSSSRVNKYLLIARTASGLQ